MAQTKVHYVKLEVDVTIFRLASVTTPRYANCPSTNSLVAFPSLGFAYSIDSKAT